MKQIPDSVKQEAVVTTVVNTQDMPMIVTVGKGKLLIQNKETKELLHYSIYNVKDCLYGLAPIDCVVEEQVSYAKKLIEEM